MILSDALQIDTEITVLYCNTEITNSVRLARVGKDNKTGHSMKFNMHPIFWQDKLASSKVHAAVASTINPILLF